MGRHNSYTIQIPYRKNLPLKSVQFQFLLEVLLTFGVSLIFWTFLFPLILLLILPVRFILQVALNLRYGKGRFTLASGIDAVFSHDLTPGSSSSPHMVLVHKGIPPPISEIRETFLQRVLPVHSSRLCRRYISRKWGFPMWEDRSSSFKIERHVKLLSSSSDSVTEPELLEKLSSLMQEKEVLSYPFPQWEFLLVPNYVPADSDYGADSQYFATIIRLHHAYGDGASFLILLDECLTDFRVQWSLHPKQLPPGMSTFDLFLLKVKSYLLGPLPFLRTLHSSMMDESGFLLRNEGYSERKFLGWTSPLNVDFFKEIRASRDISLSAVILTAFTGALRRLHERRRKQENERFHFDLEESLNIGCVSAMIPRSSELQNSFSTFSVPCPISQTDPILRLKLTDISLKRLAGSSEPLFNFFIMRLAGLFPNFIQDFVIERSGTPALYSNIPGPKGRVEAFSSDVIELGGWLPLIKTYGVGMTTTSLNGKLRVCFTWDSKFITSDEDFEDFIFDVEKELKLIGRLLGVKRPLYFKPVLTSESLHYQFNSLFKGNFNSIEKLVERRTTA